MDYSEALGYLLSLTDFEKRPASAYLAANFDLRRLEDLLSRFGAPHRRAPTVHIAGTKGKGSTAVMIGAVLQAAGFRVGLYTSPHLHTFCERLQVNGELIPTTKMAALMEKLRPEVEAINARATYGQLTTFEVLTALAFLYFQEEKISFQVLETGLGGRLDATNVVRPEVCAITSISFDHTEILGNSLAQIAGEKAGIIKAGSIVVSAPQAEEARKVIEAACHRQGARLIQVGRDVSWQPGSFDESGQSFEVTGRRGHYQLRLPLLGEHQLENAAVAVAALEVLQEKGFAIPAGSLAQGLSQVRWPGRLEVLRRNPTLVVDGAHNGDSARRLGQALRQYFSFERLILVLGTSSDKDIPGIIDGLALLAPEVILTQSRHPRSASPHRLAEEWARRGRKGVVVEGVAAALRQALAMANKGSLICVTGSLFVVAEAREEFLGLCPELYATNTTASR